MIDSMTNYTGQQEEQIAKTPFVIKGIALSQHAAYLIRRELDRNPRQSITDFIMNSETADTFIEFNRVNGLMLDYDEIVDNMHIDLASDDPRHQAFGKLVARSVPINLIDNGR